MHVLFLPSWYPTADNPIAGSFFQEQALALQKSHVKTGVIYVQLASIKTFFKKRSIPLGLYHDAVENPPAIKFFFFRIPLLMKLNRLFIEIVGVFLFRKYVKEYGLPDLLHVQAMENTGSLALKIKQKFGIPYVITEHSSKFLRGNLNRSLFEGLKQVVQQSSSLLAVSKRLADVLDTLFDERNMSWKVIPNMVSEPFLAAPLHDPLPNNITRFIAIGSLTENKGFDILIRVFSSVFAENESVELVIGGTGKERDKLDSLIHECGLSKRIKLLGRLSRSQVVEAISVSSILVVSSLKETFGVVAVEALALGKPVLATRCGGPELIIEPGDGVMVEAGDIKALEEGLAQIFKNRNSFDPRQIRSRCASRFGEASVINRVIEVYRNSLSNL